MMTMTRCWYSVQDNEDDYNDYNDDGRYSVYGDWECKRHRVFLPFGQQKEPYDKVVTIVLMVTMMIMMVNRRSP